MDQQYVNNKPIRNSSGKTMSSSSLSTASLSSSSSTSSPNIRQSQSFIYNNNSKFNNCSNNGRYANNTTAGDSNLSNKRGSNQSSNNFSNNSNVNSGRKQNFNPNKGLKNRQFYDNNSSNFNSYYGNVSFANESNTFETSKKKSAQNTTSNFDNEENTQKKYKERKSQQQAQQYKEVMNQSKKIPFNTQSSESGASSIGGVSIAPTFNLNNKYQPPPFQPPAYHQNNKLLGNHNNKQNFHQTQLSSQKNKILIEKYDRKYNLISFILLRKKDEYLVDNKYYLNDQSLYQKIDNYIEKKQLKNLKRLFLNEKSPQSSQTASGAISLNLANFTNSYNCNMFVYTIRKCLESLTSESSHFVNELITFLFRKNIRPYSFYLIDGDYPKRNLMHYAARYNFELIPRLLLQSFKETNLVKTENFENLEKTVVDKDEEGE